MDYFQYVEADNSLDIPLKVLNLIINGLLSI